MVVAIGPLTNLALASLLEPDLPSLIKEVHVMGGAVGPGNITSHSEYNFYFDAEAADGEWLPKAWGVACVGVVSPRPLTPG